MSTKMLTHSKNLAKQIVGLNNGDKATGLWHVTISAYIGRLVAGCGAPTLQLCLMVLSLPHAPDFPLGTYWVHRHGTIWHLISLCYKL